MLAQSQARVGVIIRPGETKTPDYVIENGTLPYAVEAKRPNGDLDARNIVRKAARQIRGPAYHGGMIVVDLTDCIEPALRFLVGNGPPDRTIINARMSHLVQRLHTEVFHDPNSSLRQRRAHVFGLCAFCRVAYWDMRDLAFLYLIRPVGVVQYWRNDARTPRAHRARWLTELVGDGIGASGHEGRGRATLPWSPPPSA